MAAWTPEEMEELIRSKEALLKEFFAAEPPQNKGEDLVELWRQIYDDTIRSVVLEGISKEDGKVLPYEKLHAVIRDGGNWKWPRIWRRFGELQRRGFAFRKGDPVNLDLPNPNPFIVSQNVLVVGGGPVGLRLAIELKLGGHNVTVFEKRREVRNAEGELETLGFTNRINRPHVFAFLRNDLDRLNGRDFMSSKMCYPVFTQADTSSIGIDELQMLLLKNALLLGVDIRLGVSYDDAEIILDPRNQKPRWQIKCTYDERAALFHGVEPGSNTCTFDVLMGCDGARSRVRESQPNIFGDVDKRNFKKMIGVVANLQKVTRQRLRELGFPNGQEPTDMKRAHRSGGATSGTMTGLNYYKASYHNYAIFTPSKEELERAGFSGSIYSFHQGRSKVNPAKEAEKARLKEWVVARCKEVGIPVDETLSNDGFVDAPNDVMAFDFSEIWKCKKNFAFNIPPLDYSVDEQGPWNGTSLIPPIALVGDAVTEPFWIAGVGLQRGWNGLMDACYLIDNLYNMSFSGGPEPLTDTTWNDHLQRIQNIIPTLFECSHDGRMTKEGLQGEHADQGVVMIQLSKGGKDAEKPQWHLEVDPFTRYEPLAKLAQDKYKGAKVAENLHPCVRRTLALRKISSEAEVFSAKQLVSLSGKEIASSSCQGHVVKQSSSEVAVPSAPMPIPEPEVARVASQRNDSLHSMLAKQIDLHVQQAGAMASPGRKISAFNDELWKELPAQETCGFAEIAETQWDIMTEKHLSSVQKAELVHVRNMKQSLKQQIAALTASMQAFERAERELLLSGGS